MGFSLPGFSFLSQVSDCSRKQKGTVLSSVFSTDKLANFLSQFSSPVPCHQQRGQGWPLAHRPAETLRPRVLNAHYSVKAILK